MKVHILESPKTAQYNAVTHFPTPAGDNSAGMAWKDILLAVAPNLEPRAGDEAEKAAIIAGDVIEVAFVIELEPSEVQPGALRASVDDLADKARAGWQPEMQRRYAYYSYAQDEVT